MGVYKWVVSDVSESDKVHADLTSLCACFRGRIRASWLAPILSIGDMSVHLLSDACDVEPSCPIGELLLACCLALVKHRLGWRMRVWGTGDEELWDAALSIASAQTQSHVEHPYDLPEPPVLVIDEGTQCAIQVNRRRSYRLQRKALDDLVRDVLKIKKTV